VTLRSARFLSLAAVLTFTVFAAAFAAAQDPIDPATVGACANTTDPCVPTYHNDNARARARLSHGATAIPAQASSG
jgi:hypothetical protein